MTLVSENSESGNSGRRRWAGLVVLALGLAMIVLDGTIVGVALPTVVADLHLSLTDAQWVNALYSVVFAALLLTAGALGDRLGRRTVFLVGVVVFVLGSVLAAGAHDASALIVARVVQGVGGAMVLPASLSTVNATFRGRDRAVAFGVWGAVMSGAAALGPLLGGWLTTGWGWRAVFWVNVPLGAVVLVGALTVVADTRGGAHRRGFDVDGLLASAVGFGLVVFGLIEATTLGWWRPLADLTVAGRTWSTDMPVSVVPVVLAVGAASIAAFVVWERHRARVQRDALVDLTLFRVPTFSWGNVTALSVAAGEFALVFVLPLYLTAVLGLDAMGAGWVLAAMAVGAFVSGASARHLAARLGPPTVVVVGLGLEVVGAGVVALLVGPGTSPWALAGVLAVYGIGLGLASAQLTSTVLADVPAAASGAASATQSTVRQLGSALGTALAGSALAAGLGSALVTRAAAVPGVSAEQATQAAAAVRGSAGAWLVALREAGTSGPFGEVGPALAHALSAGYARAAALAIGVAVAAMLLGLVGSLRVRAVARRVPSAAGAPGEDEPGATVRPVVLVPGPTGQDTPDTGSSAPLPSGAADPVQDAKRQGAVGA